MRQQALEEARGLEPSGFVAGSGDKQRADLLWLQIEMVSCPVRGKSRRPRVEMQRCAARTLIEARVLEQHIRGGQHSAAAGAPPRALFASHFEQIRKVVV